MQTEGETAPKVFQDVCKVKGYNLDTYSYKHIHVEVNFIHSNFIALECSTI